MTESPWKVNVDDDNDYTLVIIIMMLMTIFKCFSFYVHTVKKYSTKKSPQFSYNDQEDEGAFAPELGTGVGQLGLQAKGEKGGQVKTYI